MFLHKTMVPKTIINLICIKIEVTLTISQFFHPEEKQRTGLSASVGHVLRLSSFTQSSLTASEDAVRDRIRKGSV